MSTQLEINPSENLIQLIDRLILEKFYDGIPVLLQDNRNTCRLKDICSDAVQICIRHLTDENYNKNFELYSCCENLLRAIAQHACQEEALFELLEIIETTKSDNMFTSALKALQVCLLRFKENRARSLEWSLNSIQSYLEGLNVPEIAEKGYDEKQEKILEHDENVHRILTNYITVSLFYEPIFKELVILHSKNPFRDGNISRKNVLACFMLQLLGKPLALLDLRNRENSLTNCHSMQCANTLVRDLSELLVDPFFLLSYVEKRIRWKPKSLEDETSDMTISDIFLVEEKAPIISLGVYYYLLFAENLTPTKAPKIYNRMYFFEMSLYLAVDLFKCEEPAIHYKGLLLISKVINNLNTELICSDSLELKIHSDFCQSLTKIIIYSNIERNRVLGIQLFKEYILQFDNEGKFFLLKNLLRITNHNGLFAHFTIIYKNLIAQQLQETISSEQHSGNEEKARLSEYFSGRDLKHLLVNVICKLQNGVETDLMQQSDQIISALNIIRYLAISDKKNRTGFWNFVKEITKEFLEPLRKALELSRAHYKTEELRVRTNKEDDNSWSEKVEISLLSGESLPEMTKEHKLKMLSGAMTTFDLIESLLARVNECVESGFKEMHNKI